jgi:hypothetical protein
MFMMRYALLALFFPMILVQAAPARGNEDTLRRNKLIWESMSSEEKARMMQSYREWKSGPPQKREKMRRNYETFNELSPLERRILRERFRTYKNLKPEGREKIRQRLGRIDAMSPERREEVEKRYLRNRGRTTDERMRQMERSRFWKNLSEEERELYKNILIPSK